MPESEIVKHNLETRIADLMKEGKTEREIAETLSAETGQAITKSCVHRYLAANTRLCQEAVILSDKMKVKVLQVELDTIEARHELINKIRQLGDMAEAQGDLKTALYALDKAVNALDSLDRRLGKFTERSNVEVNLQINQFNDFMEIVLGEVDESTKERIRSKLKENL